MPAADHAFDAPFGLRVTIAAAGTVPDSLGPGTEQPAGEVAADGDRALVRFPGQWAMLVERGRDVTIEWSDDGLLPPWLVDSWAVTIAMLQRGHLCLHASVASVAGRAIAIAGRSGAGKSTTLAALHERRHGLLVDDVCALDDRDGVPWVLPFPRAVLLTTDAAALVGTPAAELSPDPGSAKSVWSAATTGGATTAPVPLAGIVVLERDTHVGVATAGGVRGPAAVALVATHAGRTRTAGRVLGDRRYLDAVTALCARVPVLHLRRPATGDSVGAVTELIESFAGVA